MNSYLIKAQNFSKEANKVRSVLYKRIDDNGIHGNAILALFGSKSIHQLGREMDELFKLSRVNYRLYQKQKEN